MDAEEVEQTCCGCVACKCQAFVDNRWLANRVGIHVKGKGVRTVLTAGPVG